MKPNMRIATAEIRATVVTYGRHSCPDCQELEKNLSTVRETLEDHGLFFRHYDVEEHPGKRVNLREAEDGQQYVPQGTYTLTGKGAEFLGFEGKVWPNLLKCLERDGFKF